MTFALVFAYLMVKPAFCLDMSGTMSGTMSAFADACAVLVVMLPLDRMGSAKKFGVMDLALKVPSGRVHGILLVKPTV